VRSKENLGYARKVAGAERTGECEERPRLFQHHGDNAAELDIGNRIDLQETAIRD
jgi:hypothetical protein